MKKLNQFLKLVQAIFLLLVILSSFSPVFAAQNWPSGIVSTSPLTATIKTQLGLTEQAFPGGKVASTHCASNGYETFPSGYFYAAPAGTVESLSQNVTFMNTYPNAFQCDGNIRFYFGGTLYSGTPPPASPTTPPPGTPTIPPTFGTINWDLLTFNTNITGLDSLIVITINWLFGIAGALAVIAIIYSGVLYITAAGDLTAKDKPNQIMKAKKNLAWAITGLIVLFLSYMLIVWIGRLVTTGQT